MVDLTPTPLGETDMTLMRQEMPSIPREARKVIREGRWSQNIAGICNGYVKANVCIVPKELAYDFLVFCQRNPKCCPVLEVLDPGDPIIKELAKDADIRTDLPKYSVFVKGETVDEPTDIVKYWRDDLVTFLFGASGTFDEAIARAGIPAPWLDQTAGETTPSVFVTNIPTVPAGRLHGPMVVSMRPILASHVARVVQVTSRFPKHHGAPVHIGDPGLIGIDEISNSQWLPGIKPQPGEVPVFWACGVTPQTVALESKPDLMITHYPGHALLCDAPAEHHSDS